MTRLALSLVILRDEFDDTFPGRSKVSDGWIGNEAHRRYDSRHNPNDDDVVTALDITHDPDNGLDVHAEARELVDLARRGETNPDFEYVISDGEIAKRRTGFAWEPYYGKNQHRTHAHFAVGRGSDGDPRPPYDSTDPWGIAEEDDMIRDGKDIEDIQEDLNWLRVHAFIQPPYPKLKVDGVFGANTLRALEVVRGVWGRRPRGDRPSSLDVSKLDRFIHEVKEHALKVPMP